MIDATIVFTGVSVVALLLALNLCRPTFVQKYAARRKEHLDATMKSAREYHVVVAKMRKEIERKKRHDHFMKAATQAIRVPAQRHALDLEEM